MNDESRGTLHSFFAPNHHHVQELSKPERDGYYATEQIGSENLPHEIHNSVVQLDRTPTQGTAQANATKQSSDSLVSKGPAQLDGSTDITMNEAERQPERQAENRIPQDSASNMSKWPISSKPTVHQRKRRKVEHQQADRASGEGGSDASFTEDNIAPITEPRECTEHESPTSVENKHAKAQVPVAVLFSDATKTPPKKMLKIGRSGKLGSPSESPAKLDNSPAQARKRGRPRKVHVALSRTVIMHYSTEALLSETSIASHIERILAGEERHERVPPRRVTPPPPARPSGPPKPAHPFFTGKLRKQTEALKEESKPIRVPAESPRRPSAVTPGKIRRQIQEIKSLQNPTEAKGELAAPSLKTAPQRTEIWPLRGALHVRGDIEHKPCLVKTSFHRRKQKQQVVPVHASDSILRDFEPVTLLKGYQEGRTRPDGFQDPHPSLRVPLRKLLTGPEILENVVPSLKGDRQHQALVNLQKSITNHLTAYDHGRGEPLPWTHKYAPSNAASVLQSGQEAVLLRDWMRALTVSSTTMTSANTSKLVEGKSRKKRRKRNDELDDFIISDGDESDQLGSLTDVDEPGSQGSRESMGKSMVRTALDNAQGEGRRTANAVVLSGPHGCGKTAMVLAAAKELNFQVFEINSGSRRSGRDVLERIGDVLGNHIVSHDKPDAGNVSADEDSTRHSAALQKDLDSGRQGTMNSFFTSKAPKAMSKPKQKKAASSVQPKPEPSRHQKQSIILLEEVDVLFEDDKAFWTTVLSVITTSRRPVIMTCTDESLLPLDDLILHAIFRLSPPPGTLATDYLLLLAAQEGHFVDRDAISSLYDQKKRDLRASITELQFWCQLGVGDPRGGLSWIFQRWPAGTGVDANGNVQRVVSDGSYHAGMGWLPYERSDLQSDAWAEELLLDAWGNWAVDPRDEAHFSIATAHKSSTCRDDEPSSRLEALKAMEDLADSLSALDLLPSINLPSRSTSSRYSPLGSTLSTPLDPTQPPLTNKKRASYTEYPRLLQVDALIEPTNLTRNLITSASHLLSKTYSLPLSNPSSSPSSHLLTSHHHDLIRHPTPPSSTTPLPAITFYTALDPLSYPSQPTHPVPQAGGYTFLLSPLPPISTDIAPYVRSIVAHDVKLEQDRRKLHEVLHGTETGPATGTGKMRRTRAARGALEGKGRGGVRRERWWDCEVDVEGVLGTGGRGWGEVLGGLMEREEREREEAEVRVAGVQGVVEDVVEGKVEEG